MRIKVTCPDCPQVAHLQPDSLRTVSCEHGAQCVWQCPGCGFHVSCRVDAGKLADLTREGVPALVAKPDRRPDLPPLTEDDLLRLGLKLEALPNGVR